MLGLLLESAILVMLGVGAALADDDHPMVQDLEEKGAVEIAHGQLIQEINVTCFRTPVYPSRGDDGCRAPNIVYGEFRRLKLHESEFVCISFRHWACFESK
jgi:hypothetical protein